MSLHPRALLPMLRSRLAKRSVVVLTGARQTGKTTCVRDLLPREGDTEALYFSLDDPDERIRLSADPVRRLDHPGKLVILDEVQKLPSLLDAVKVIADRHPSRRFLLLGSSQVLLLRGVRETLAGRATLLDLWPLALVERIDGDAVPASGLDRLWAEGSAAAEALAASSPSVDPQRRWSALAEDHVLWGGHPSLEPLADEDRRIWLRDFRRTYLERDLADLGRVADLDQFALAQNLLAARTAQVLSYSEVSRDLGVAVNTVKRYVRFLEVSYQVHLLRPLAPNVTSRLVKSPKLYWSDPGLARFLCGRTDPGDGAIFETAVLDELLRWSSWQDDPPELHFYRTHAGLEVDFVLTSRNRVLAIEAKAGRRAARQDARPLVELLQLIGIPDFGPKAERVGIVVTQGREVEALGPGVWAIPFWRLFGPAA